MGNSDTYDRAILLVEDEAVVRMDVASHIGRVGFTIYEAESADKAIDLLEIHRNICLIFTDIHLPGSMDGLELAHRVRDRWPPIKIVIASGQLTIHDKLMPSGSVFFAKPYCPERITSIVREMVGEAV